MASNMSRKGLLQFIAECNKKSDDASGPAISGVKKSKGGKRKEEKGKNVTIVVEDSAQTCSDPATRKRRKKSNIVDCPLSPSEDLEELMDRLLLNYVDLPDDVDSLWLSSSPPTQIIDKHVVKEADVGFYKKLGPIQCSQAMEMLGLRLVTLAKFTEMEASSVSKMCTTLEMDNAQMKKRISDNQLVVKNAEDKIQQLSQVQKELQKVQADMASLKSKAEQLTKTNSKLSLSRDDLAAKLGYANEKTSRLEEKSIEMKVDTARYLNEGFSAALEQFACVYPDLDLGVFSIFKEVRGGKLMSMNEEEIAENMEEAVNVDGVGVA